MNKTTGGELHLIRDEDKLDRFYYSRDQQKHYFSLAWNKGAPQQVVIDEVPYTCPSDSLIPLMIRQSFRFANSKDIVAWQFNREFYCMADHDKEVGCVGFLFFGNSHIPILHLEKQEQIKFQNLLNVFQEEFEVDDLIKGDMLLMLLKRLIIKATRLAKSQYLPEELEVNGRFDVIRNFNLLVETHFRKQHSVQFYAAEMNKSPKTLSNLFAIYNHKSPLEVIQGRLVLEAKRLFYYTDKSAKEVGYELGFEDPAHFSRFFKNDTGLSPSQFKKNFKVV